METAAAQADSSLRGSLLAGARAMNLRLTESRAGVLLEYLRLLEKWNSRFNLSAVLDIEQMLDRHLLDSLSISPWMVDDTVVDAGSGAGLPGIPLAVLFPKKRFVLVDSNGKKNRFLLQAKLTLGLTNVEVEQCRIELYQGPADLVVCRALATLAESAEKTRQLLAKGAALLAMKGRYPAEELANLPPAFAVEFVERLRVPGAADRHLVGIKLRG